MIKTINQLYYELNDYSNINGKIARMVKAKELIPLTKGIYETDASTPGYEVAGSIYGPSYLSFDFALAYYGLIPEAVYAFTSATYDKKKKKEYHNALGDFYYRDVPKKAYPYGIKLIDSSSRPFLIASPEKALCDKLYTMPPIYSVKQLKIMLFADLRIYEGEFNKLNKQDLLTYSELYNSTNLKILNKIIRKELKISGNNN